MKLELDLRLLRFGCEEMNDDKVGTESNCFRSVIDHEQSRWYFCCDIFREYLFPVCPQKNATKNTKSDIEIVQGKQMGTYEILRHASIMNEQSSLWLLFQVQLGLFNPYKILL